MLYKSNFVRDGNSKKNKDIITEGQLNDLDLWYRNKQITNE